MLWEVLDNGITISQHVQRFNRRAMMGRLYLRGISDLQETGSSVEHWCCMLVDTVLSDWVSGGTRWKLTDGRVRHG